nr:hypothetical protein [Tanacetum cinerariifolium]
DDDSTPLTCHLGDSSPPSAPPSTDPPLDPPSPTLHASHAQVKPSPPSSHAPQPTPPLPARQPRRHHLLNGSTSGVQTYDEKTGDDDSTPPTCHLGDSSPPSSTPPSTDPPLDPPSPTLHASHAQVKPSPPSSHALQPTPPLPARQPRRHHLLNGSTSGVQTYDRKFSDEFTGAGNPSALHFYTNPPSNSCTRGDCFLVFSGGDTSPMGLVVSLGDKSGLDSEFAMMILVGWSTSLDGDANSHTRAGVLVACAIKTSPYGSSPLTQIGLTDFLPGRTVVDAAHRSSPLTQIGLTDFFPGRAVVDAAHRKCADVGYGFLPFSFSSLGELEKDAVALLKRI